MKYYKLGCSTVIENCKNYTKEDYFRILEQYQTLGVRHIEYSHPQTMREEDAAEIERFSNQLGLCAWSVHGCPWGFDRDDAAFFAQFEHDCVIGEILRAHVVVLHPMEKHKDGSPRMEVYLKAAEIAHAHALELAIETGIPTDTGMPGYEELIALADEINLPYVGINVDVGHSFSRERRDVEEVIRAVGARLKTLHLHDNYAEHDDHQAPGVGYIDWHKVIAALKENPYEGPLMLEMTDSKQGRTVPQLREMTVDKEILFADNLFRHIWIHG